MVIIEFFVNLWKNAWQIVSGIKVDGVPITKIFVALFIFTVIVGGLISARR